MAKRRKAGEVVESRAPKRRAFEDVQDEPCPVCLELAQRGEIQARAVMPLPKFPARLRTTNQPCCRDCQATETGMAMGWQHPDFGAARLTVANERCEGLVMPLGMMENMGQCLHGIIAPCSFEDLQKHLAWGRRHGIPNDIGCVPFGPYAEEEEE
jgi:hypothetical protein